MSTPNPNRSAAPVISVRGEAILEVEPEIAQFTVTVAARDRDRQTALNTLTARVAAVRAVLDGYADAIERRETGNMQVRPELRRRGERVSAYVAHLATTVMVTDFADLGELLLRLADEEQTSVYGPSWGLRPDSDVYRRARRAAVDEALVRAGEYADAVGARLERLLELADTGMSGGHDVSLAYDKVAFRAAAESTADLELEPQRQTVHAGVEMRFLISEPTTALPPRV
jgi:uncharacterized protein YggE